jgi:hypothetical protein
VSAVLLAIFVVALDDGDAYHRICDVAPYLMYTSGVELVAAVLMLALLRAWWWSPLLACFALLWVAVTVRLSVGLLYYAMLGRDSCLLRDTVNIKAMFHMASPNQPS